jgi:stress-induced morphogen
METDTVETLIEDGIPDAEATVTTPRDPDDDDHYAAVVVTPAFEGESLVDRHQRVYDALDEQMHNEIHAIEIRAFTPEEYEES